MDSLATPLTPQASALRLELRGLLLAAQNSDGGWPFHLNGDSRVEPTCWALLVLSGSDSTPPEIFSRALNFLNASQHKDGSWSATSAMEDGSWVTSLACLTLACYPQSHDRIAAGLQWLCDDYPRDSSGWQKFLKKLQSRQLESHNDEFRGWGWTPRTSSWVEPTSFALLAFAAAPNLAAQSALLAKSIADRTALATGLLYDRMCPRGGWNCGNPRVYGVDGDPLVPPTCFALLALRYAPDHPHRALSLQWLQSEYPKIQSPGSLALAQIALDSYALPFPPSPRSLLDFPASELAGQGTHIASWAALALSSARHSPLATRHFPL